MSQLPLQVGLFAPGHLDHVRSVLEGIQAYNPDWAVSHIMPMPTDPPLKQYIRRLEKMPFDALICDADFDLWQYFGSKHPPIAWFFGWKEPPWGPSVRIREEQVGQIGAEFLADEGYEHLAFLGAEPVWSLRRQRGFLEACRRRGLPCSLTYPEPARPGQPTWAEILQHDFLVRWVGQLPKPVAVMTCSAHAAPLLAMAVRSLSLRVGGDVGILTGEDTPIVCETTWPGISAVDLGLERLGYQSARLLQDVLDQGPEHARSLQLDPVGIVRRDSTNFEPGHDDVLSASLAYLRNTPLDQIQLSTMYEQTPASQRTVQRRFAEKMGTTPAQYVQKMRIRQAQHLLRTTSMPLVDISVRCGFEFVSNFCRSFKATVGKTPTQYRRVDGDLEPDEFC
jgi:LacI family transcriptional regulator